MDISSSSSLSVISFLNDELYRYLNLPHLPIRIYLPWVWVELEAGNIKTLRERERRNFNLTETERTAGYHANPRGFGKETPIYRATEAES